MTRRRKITLIIVAAVSLAGIAFWLLRPREPEYQGRPLSAWLEDLTATRDGVDYERAVAAIQVIGTKAVPQLLQLAHYEDSDWRIEGDRLVGFIWENASISLPIQFCMQRESEDRALLGFRALGPEANNAVPALAELLKQSDRPSMVPLYLQAIGTSAIPALTSALSLSNRANRVSSVMALAGLGKGAESAVPQIVATINTNDPSSHKSFLMTLGAIGQHPELAVPALTRALDDPSVEVRVAAALSLAKFGPEAESARPALEIAAKHPFHQLSSAAQKALDRLNAAR